MKKALFTFFLFILGLQLSAQINLEDSTVQVLSHWNKGDVRNYIFFKSKKATENNQNVQRDEATYLVELSVIDSTATSYTMQWHYMGCETNGSEQDKAMYALVKGLKIRYKISQTGEFEEVLNWEEVRDMMNISLESMMKNIELTRKAADTEHLEQARNFVLNSFGTKEAIEAVGINEILVYHAFHGLTLRLNEPLKTTTQVPNAMGGKPFDAHLDIWLDKISDDQESYFVRSTKVISKEQLLKVTLDYLKKLSESGGFSYDPASLKDLNIENKMEYAAQIDSMGWVIKNMMEKTVTNGEYTLVETYAIAPYE